MYRNLIFFLLVRLIRSYSECPSGFHVNITGGIQVADGVIKNGVKFSNEAYLRDDYTLWGCICAENCVRKCCRKDEIVLNGMCVNQDKPADNQTRLFIRGCDQTMYIAEEYFWEQLRNGSISQANANYTLGFDDFCLDESLDNRSVFMCIFSNSGDPDGSTKIPEPPPPFPSTSPDPCDEKICVRKCCGSDEIFSENKTCLKQQENSSRHLESLLLGINFTEDTHKLVSGELVCANGSHRFATGDFRLDPDGVVNWEGVTVGIERYCLEVIFDEDEKYSLKAVICEVEDADVIEDHLHSTGMIISMPFLLATFLVYALLPEPNLHRRALMSYVITLLLGYILLVAVQLSTEEIAAVPCHLLAYSIIFFFTVSFFWMNVMCLDMWLAFRGMRGFGSRKEAELKRFIIYCLYAWGMPLLAILAIFLLNTYGDEAKFYYPAIGVERCFVGEGLPNFLYFYLLAMIILVINIILFALTGIKIYRVQKETLMLKQSDSKRHSYEDDKQQYKLYLKLLFAMGVNWSTEIISWAVKYFWQDTPKALFYFTDFINATYGVFIFFIFVFKRKIWKSLQKRYYIFIGKPHLAHAMSTTRGGTRTSNFSTTETGTTVNTDYRLHDMKNGKGEERALNRH